MFRFSYAAKVGLIFLVAIFLFFTVLRTLGYDLWRPKAKGYYITAVFETTKGLQKGYEVQYNGYWLGEVFDIKPHSFGDVAVILLIYNDRSIIHENASFTIAQQSIFGANLVYIGESKGGALIARGNENGNTYTLQMPRGQTILHSNVYYHGETIGTVVDIINSPDEKFTDIVTIELEEDVDVNLNSEQSFVASRLREKRMPLTSGVYTMEEVVTGRIDVFDRLNDGAIVEGHREPGPEDLVVSANELVESVGGAIGNVSDSLAQLVASVDGVLSALSGELAGEGEGTIKSELVIAIQELQSGLENIQTLTTSLNDILDDAQPRIDGIFENVEDVTRNIEAATTEITDFLTDPEVSESIKASITNLEMATDSVLKTIEEIESLISDEEMQDDIRVVLSGARETIEKASETLDTAKGAFDTFSDTDFGGEFRVRYLPDPDRFASDLQFYLDPGGGNPFYYEVWIEDIGETDDLSFQLGYPFKDGWRGRIGVKRGHIGAGFDYDSGLFKIKGDIYDPNDLHLDLYGSWAISDDISFVLGFEDISEEDLFLVGIATEF